MNKTIDKLAKVLTGVGALNWGTARLLGFDVLSYVPSGMFTTVVVGAIGASGAYVLWQIWKKKI